MCLILLREPNVTLDRGKFDTAVLNNLDGWGLSVPDCDGKLYTMRSVTTNKDELYDLIHGEFKKDKLMLHLRYTTTGDTVLRNAHPFPVLEQGEDGVDLRMCHNGTLPSWAPRSTDLEGKWESDTRRFVRGYVRPLMKRLIKGMSIEDILTDPFVGTLLDDQLTAASVITFIDGHGNFSVVNEKGNGGFRDDDGTYFSNKYSHDPEHRLPYTQKSGYKPVGKNYGTTTTMGGGPKTGTSTSQKTGVNKRFIDCTVQSFMEKYSLTDSDDLHLLSDDTLQILVEDTPEDTLLLIKELLSLHYKAERAVKTLTLKGRMKDKRIKTLEAKLKEETKG